MVYNSRSQEEDSVRERKRQQDNAERVAAKSKEIADKMADFLSQKLSGARPSIAQTNCSSYDVKKLSTAVKDNTLTVFHRGYEIAISCSNPAALSAELRKWLAVNMSHITKIEPRQHS